MNNPTFEVMCRPGGCIFHQGVTRGNPSRGCKVRNFTCPYSSTEMSKIGDIKVAMQAWGYRARIHPIDRQKGLKLRKPISQGSWAGFFIEIIVPRRKILEITNRLSPRLPLGMVFGVKSLPWWRNWRRRVVVL